MLIAIIGPDGCGKTTVANSLVEKLKDLDVVATHHAMHFKILPKLKDILNLFLNTKIVSGHKEGEYHAGMMAKPNTALRGSLYVFWYALDYFLGRLRLFVSRNRGEIVVFARYYLDYYFQRGHINTPHSVIRLFEFLVPTPSIIVTINRTAEDIFSLKPELTIDEINRQQRIIEALFTQRRNAFVVDGSKGVENTVDQIIELIEINS